MKSEEKNNFVYNTVVTGTTFGWFAFVTEIKQ